MIEPRTVHHVRRWALPVIVLLLAALLRFYQPGAIPPGLTHDEAGHGHDAAAILRGARPLYETVGYGREPLYDYLLAGLMALTGPTNVTLRLAAALLGLATLLCTWAWVRRAFDEPTALVAVAGQAASFWSLATGRQALRSGLLPVLFTAAVYFYWSAFYGPERTPRRRPDLWRLGLLALLLGATLYTYLPARVLWLLFPAFMLYLAVAGRRSAGLSLHRFWFPTLAAVLTGLLLAAPLLVYLRGQPGAEQRLAMLDAPLRALLAGDPSAVLDRARSSLLAFFVPGRGDTFLAYTIPGRPIFDPLTGALFLVGVGLCLARFRDPARGLALLWLIVGVSPSLVTGAPALTTRSIAVLPVAFLFPALAAVDGARWAAHRWGRRAAWAGRVAIALWIAASGAVAARDYFLVWGRSPDVRAAYQHTLVEIAHYLDTSPEGGTVALSTLYPHAPHDPYVLEMSLRRGDLPLRWLDGRRALLIPAQPAARLITPSSAPLADYFAALPGLVRREQVSLWPDDLDPYFVVYDWQPPLTLAALQEQTAGGTAEPALPADFGGVLRLIGYELRTPTVAAGGEVELLTLWEVVDPLPLWPGDLADVQAEVVLFIHALDGSGAVVGQEDRLDAPCWDWQAGDVIAQLHRFALAPDVSPGPVALQVGAYRPADGVRLPVLVDGVAVGDQVRLQETLRVLDPKGLKP